MLTIEPSSETTEQQRNRSICSGKPVEIVARELIECGIRNELALDDILNPFRNEVTASGVSDDELATLFEEARNGVHEETKNQPLLVLASA